MKRLRQGEENENEHLHNFETDIFVGFHIGSDPERERKWWSRTRRRI